MNISSRLQGWIRLALLVGLSFAAADLTSVRIERRLQVPPRQATPTPGAPNATAVNPAPPGLSSLGDLQTVLSTTVPPAPPPGSANETAANGTAPVAVPSPTGPPPRLTGTLAGGGHSLAVLMAGPDTKVVGVGESMNGFEVVEVGQYSATLRDPAGHNVTLTMDLANLNGGNSTAQAPPPTAATPAPPVVANATAGPPKGATLSVGELRAMLDHPEKYANAIQVKAIRKGEEIIGMQVNYSVSDNPFAKLGVNTGDVVTSLNGHPLKGPEDLTWAYGELRNAQELNFQLERNGQAMPLTVQLTQ